MNYLVQLELADRPATPQEGIVSIEQFILPTFKLRKKLEAEKRIVARGPLGGAIARSLIVRAESVQALDNLVSSPPVWPQMETTVTPLSGFEVRMRAVHARLEQLKIEQLMMRGGAR